MAMYLVTGIDGFSAKLHKYGSFQPIKLAGEKLRAKKNFQ